MKLRLVSALFLGLTLSAAYTQDAAQQIPGPGPRGGMGMPIVATGTMGTVTAVAADHYLIRTDAGDTYTVHFSVNTRILKQRIRGAAPGQPADAPQPPGPLMLKPSEIEVGDVIAVNGELDTAAKSVGAVFIVKLDPQRVQQAREMEASYGKTWLIGRVTAIDGVKVTVHGGPDNADHSFVADQNTTIHRRREPITLADIQIGDMVHAQGTLKDGTFTATSVAVMVIPRPRGTPMLPQRDTPPQ